MKKITKLKTLYIVISSGFLMSASSAFAKQVPETDARTVAENFFRKHTESVISSELGYTSIDATGNPLFYAFNFNNNSGFVLVSADNNASPIIGYSTEQGFQKPDSRSPLAFWLSKRESEIKFIREKNIASNAAIVAKWNQYFTPSQGRSAAVNTNTVAPLLLTKWNQSPFYNDSCPGGSVTGCVATTMAQIMRYWSYPVNGTGASSYCDCNSSGYPNNYGTLTADYSAVPYNWSNMPLTINTHNADIAGLMYKCGVSVEMNYDPTGSSAAVINLDSPVSAENSYVSYFNYDPATISGVYRGNYSDAAWLTLLKNDLDIARPVQYAGFGNQGGHTWVCDGYDDNDLFHMNWGWGGAGNGYFDVDGLNPIGEDFNSWQEGLFGIVPIANPGIDAGIVSISQVANSCTNVQYSPALKLRNYGSSLLTSCTINYKLDNGTMQSFPWTGSLVSGQATDVTLSNFSLANGAHVLSCSISNANNGTDVNASNDQSAYSFAVYGSGTLPISEGFEIPSQTTNSWAVVPSPNGANWAFTSQAFSGGAQSIMINNLTNNAGNTSVLQGLDNYDFSSVAHPYFHFKIAYQQKVTTNNDKLSLEISNDCGLTWWTKWSKQGAALATTTALSASAFVPAQSDFVEYAIPGVISRNTIFRWVFTSDAAAPGNNVYLDDINLGEGATVGIAELASTDTNFEIYPNPGSGETTLKFTLTKTSLIDVNVTDITGRQVIGVAQANYSAGEQLIVVNKDNSLSRGVYLVTLSGNGIKLSRKLVIN